MVPPHEDPALRLRVVTLRVTLMDPATWSRNHAARRRSLLVDNDAAAAAPKPVEEKDGKAQATARSESTRSEDTRSEGTARSEDTRSEGTAREEKGEKEKACAK